MAGGRQAPALLARWAWYDLSMFGLPRDVFAWLLAVRLLGSAIWSADSAATSNERRAMVWTSEVAKAYWSAEQERWAEEEARQDAMVTHRTPERLAEPSTHPWATWYRDATDEEETAALAGLDLPARRPPPLLADRWESLGPRRPNDLFRAHRRR